MDLIFCTILLRLYLLCGMFSDVHQKLRFLIYELRLTRHSKLFWNEFDWFKCQQRELLIADLYQQRV